MWNLDSVVLKISDEKPPIWDEAHKLFTLDDSQTVYTYGDTIYNPGGIGIDIMLLEHEKAHFCEQEAHAGGPAGWWKQYFADDQFRWDQEFEAFWYQYREFCRQEINRDKRFRYRLHLAKQFIAGSNGIDTGVQQVVTLLKSHIHK